MSDLDELMTVGLHAAQQSSSIILEALNRPRNPDFKGKTNLVTETDRRSEEAIISILSTEFPDHRMLAEESGGTDADSDYLWVIDPLDGTTNFVHGYPPFAVSIACLIKGIPSIGIVAELPKNQVYTAKDGNGAQLDGESINVSNTDHLEKSLLVTGFGYEHGEKWETNMVLYKRFTDITQGVRRLGAAALDFCHVALGILDGFWEFDLSPWDSAAGILLVKEAGGKVTRMDGEPFSIFDDNLLATNGSIHQEMEAIISPALANLKKRK